MKRVGTVVRTVGRVAVVRSPDETAPDIGGTVLDEQLDPVGRIVDVMGPTARPYVVVAPVEGVSSASILNERLYVR